ncbi:MAG: hypothetical protein K0S74_1571 [Chlamydiales bacterium]|nr:hypothetical protein [Chlamydiales bacterium]
MKYKNIDDPSLEINDLGKFVLVKMKTQNNLLESNELKVTDNGTIDLENNQIIITPTFGEKETGKFLSANNPNYRLFGMGLDSQASSIAQDRLPIKKITTRSKVSHHHLSIAIKLAENKANKEFYRLNGSYMDTVKKSLSYLGFSSN